MRKTSFFALLLACILHQPIVAQQPRAAASPSVTYLVSDAGDAADPDIVDGIYDPPTLRSAIENANFNGGTNSIVFAAGLTLIQPLSPLSGLTDQVTIDGTVAAGKIILDGSLVPVNTSGIFLSAPNSTVRNMEIRGWYAGINFAGTAPNCVIQKNIFTQNTIGVSASVSNTLVGGPNPEDRNLVYGNTQDGISVAASANDVVIQNNFCGTPDGLTAGPNTRAGIYLRGQRTRVLENILSGNQGVGLEITSAAVNALVRGNIIGADSTRRGLLPNIGDGIRTSATNDSIVDNVITGNANGVTMLSLAEGTVIRGNIIGPNGTLDSLFGNRFDGIYLLGPGAVIDSNVVSANKINGIRIAGVGGAIVRRNMIGTDPTGMLDWGNTSAGVLIQACTTTVGGPSPGDRNIVSGNGGAGVEIYGSLPAPNTLFGNIIQYNLLGTDITGTAALPNTTGLLMRGYVDTNFVRNNLISGNHSHGIWTRRTPTAPSRNLFEANLIGTQADSVSPLPNDSAGVMIDSATVNLFGGTGGADGNIIAFHPLPGIVVKAGRGTAFLRNSIFSNRGLGIDLGGDGPTLNDSADLDDGANGLQNFPRITWLDAAGGSTTVKGYLRSVPDTDFRLEFYTNDEADTTGFGEGQTFQYSVDIHTDTDGFAGFDVTLPGEHGRVVATATHPDQGTSEFSKSPLIVNSVADRPAANPASGSAATSGPQVDGVPEVTLRSAIEASNQIAGEDDVAFDIPGSDPYFIQPQTPLPSVTGDISIDGSTQPNYDSTAVPVIRLMGSAAGPTTDGLHLTGDISSVRALYITGFTGNGIRMDGDHLRLSSMTSNANKGCGVRAANDVTLEGENIFSSNGPSTDRNSIDCSDDDLAGLWLAGWLRGAGTVTASGNCGIGIRHDGPPAIDDSEIDLKSSVTADGNSLDGLSADCNVRLKGEKFQFLSNGTPAWLGAGIQMAAGNLVIEATDTGNVPLIRANGNSFHGIVSSVGTVTLKGRAELNNNGAGISEVRSFNNLICGLRTEADVFANTIESSGNGWGGVRVRGSLFVVGDLTVKNHPGRGVWATYNINVDGGEHLLENNRDQAMWAANGRIDVKGTLTARNNKIGGRYGSDDGPDLADVVIGSVMAYTDFTGDGVVIENNEPAGLSAWGSMLLRGNVTVSQNALRGAWARYSMTIEGESHVASDNGGDGLGVNNGTIRISGHLLAERNGTNPDLVAKNEGYGISAQIIDLQRATIRDNARHGALGYTSVTVRGPGIVTGNGGSGLASENFIAISGGRICDNVGYGILSPRVRVSGTQVCNNGLGGIFGKVIGPAPGASAVRSSFGESADLSAPSIVVGSSIDGNTGDGLVIDNPQPSQISGSNITGNTLLGVNNEGAGQVVADGNWWGAPSGPGGAIGGSVQASSWLSSPVVIYAGYADDTVFVLPGEADSLPIAVVNWANPADSLTVYAADVAGWTTPVESLKISLQDSLAAVVFLPYSIPPGSSAGESSPVIVTAGSLTNPGETAADTFYFAVYQPALSEVTILGDTLAVHPGDTLMISATGFDQTGQELPFIAQWSATGGAITSEGVYTAGPDTGVFIVAVNDSAATLNDSAVIRILSPAGALPPPVLGLSTASVTMGAVPVGAQDSVPVALTNTSGDILRIDSIRTRTPYFTAIYFPDVTQLRVGDTFFLLIEFSPDSIRPYEDTLFIYSNATVSPATISLDGAGVVTDVRAEDRRIPETYELGQNYPNPFNPTTTLTYGLPVGGRVSLRIYDVLGREVITLVDDIRNAGVESVPWNAVDAHGIPVSSGIYFYRLEVAGTSGEGRLFTQVRKMLLLR